jgi:hypothetical protein
MRLDYMTEEEWLSRAEHDLEMLNVVDGGSPRKLRLYAVACARRVWGLLPYKPQRDVILVAERFADGKADWAELERTAQRAAQLRDEYLDIEDQSEISPSWAALGTAEKKPFYAANSTASRLSDVMERWATVVNSTRQAEDAARANLLYDVFGNPYRPAILNPSWRTDAVLASARGAYGRRSRPLGHLDTSRLGRLAAALEKAGCDDRPLLDHLRSAGPHVRGCWALDCVLELGGTPA